MGEKWCPIAAREYHPLSAGSLDGTDTEPHDRAVWRALHSTYTPPDVDCQHERTLFVGRLPHKVAKDKLHQMFSRFGVVEQAWLVRDLVTGTSKGYGFVQFRRKKDAAIAFMEAKGIEFEGCPALVDWEAGHKLKGWVPRRLGGGWGGRKEAGQLRFGCRDRPWKKPIILPLPNTKTHQQTQDQAKGLDVLSSGDDKQRSQQRNDKDDGDRNIKLHKQKTESTRQHRGRHQERRTREKDRDNESSHKSKKKLRDTDRDSESSHEHKSYERERRPKERDGERNYEGRSRERERRVRERDAERRVRERDAERSDERDRTYRERRHESERSRDEEKRHERERNSKGRSFIDERNYEHERNYKKSSDYKRYYD
ncbi:hypothetical protein Pcinc_027624 [Petrolisthes cinctipes]|uniref:RRM domain-containing protein n=1 Tax=Petrolisthes cinctipes TaxID=88211 RepID=A0AAE1F5M2_PETCI|nr:hypothetical protein Pcinc_027624 [Petrolisthes cinctipes]